jgi:hypothetical protein
MTVSITFSKKMLVTALAAVLVFGGAVWTFAQGGEAPYLYACVKGDDVRLVLQPSDCKRQETPAGIPTEQTILALEAQNAGLQAQVDALQVALDDEIAARTAADASIADLLQHFSRDGDDVYITGANLHVVNGTGTTSGAPNSLGNVIVGYNELKGDGTDDRSGSHMLVVGSGNSYSAFGGLVAGNSHTVTGHWASVSGGHRNTASGFGASVSGGLENLASGGYSSVGGGSHNTASSGHATVSGGSWNTANFHHTTVSGGYRNTASDFAASVSGGLENRASNHYASVGGGYQLTADDRHEFQPR